MAKAPLCGWTLEEAARKRGAMRIAGLDEVGRGPLFGPVVAAAVILPEGCRLDGLTDSKKLTEKKRNEFEVEIRVLLGTQSVRTAAPPRPSRSMTVTEAPR